MKYLALYRKYRPKTFDEVSGQQIIVKTLKNIIKNNKLTHSYLFIGPRGTGKTSIAKIFAKTINCENVKDGISCEKCENCITSNNNENIDIIEMDAASNNGVDEIREIKNHVTLLPSKSKYKVYIIDEVHMLTIEAFNALLKTLEEPPKHVIFILATTEPQKVPLTIKSRCQNFEFKLLSETAIKERIKEICEKEKIKIDDESLNLISSSSNGGMRDALSFLDQVNAYSDNDIKIEDVTLLNGRISNNEIEKLLKNIKNNDFEKVFTMVDKIENEGKNFLYICEDMTYYLKNVLINFQKNIESEIFELSDKNNIMDSIIEFSNCINNMKLTKDKRIYFDLSLIKIINIFNNQTNVLKNNNTNTNNDIKLLDKENIRKSNKKEEEKNNTIDNFLYEKLMKIRLNNILIKADKDSLTNYKETLKKISNNISNLDDLKIINLLNDCNVNAGSIDGLIITTDNNNILDELYINYKEIESLFSKFLNKKIFVSLLNEENWLNERKKYVVKIKNKEKLEFMDDSDIIKEIEKKENKSEFDDLLEIGE